MSSSMPNHSTGKSRLPSLKLQPCESADKDRTVDRHAALHLGGIAM